MPNSKVFTKLSSLFIARAFNNFSEYLHRFNAFLDFPNCSIFKNNFLRLSLISIRSKTLGIKKFISKIIHIRWIIILICANSFSNPLLKIIIYFRRFIVLQFFFNFFTKHIISCRISIRTIKNKLPAKKFNKILTFFFIPFTQNIRQIFNIRDRR